MDGPKPFIWIRIGLASCNFLFPTTLFKIELKLHLEEEFKVKNFYIQGDQISHNNCDDYTSIIDVYIHDLCCGRLPVHLVHGIYTFNFYWLSVCIHSIYGGNQRERGLILQGKSLFCKEMRSTLLEKKRLTILRMIHMWGLLAFSTCDSIATYHRFSMLEWVDMKP